MSGEKTIYELMGDVMREVQAVGKDRKNTQQGYSFRSIEEIYNTVHVALSRCGVFCAPNVLSTSVCERTSKSGAIQLHTKVRIQYVFYGPKGDHVECTIENEGLDTSDKSTNKALSQADKYCLIQMFKIPYANMADADDTTPTAGLRKSPSSGPSLETQLRASVDLNELASSLIEQCKACTSSSGLVALWNSDKFQSDFSTLTAAQQKGVRSAFSAREASFEEAASSRTQAPSAKAQSDKSSPKFEVADELKASVIINKLKACANLGELRIVCSETLADYKTLPKGLQSAVEEERQNKIRAVERGAV